MLYRIAALIIKELLTMVRDPKSRALLIFPPILQLLIFSFAATLEVKNVSLVIYNEDNGRHGYELVQRLAGSSTFTGIHFVRGQQEIAAYVDRQKVLAAVHIPQDFSRRIESGEQGKLQIILDGRRSNAAQIVSGYITQLVSQYSREIAGPDASAAVPVSHLGDWGSGVRCALCRFLLAAAVHHSSVHHIHCGRGPVHFRHRQNPAAGHFWSIYFSRSGRDPFRLRFPGGKHAGLAPGRNLVQPAQTRAHYPERAVSEGYAFYRCLGQHLAHADYWRSHPDFIRLVFFPAIGVERSETSNQPA